MNVQDRESLHAYQRLARQLDGLLEDATKSAKSASSSSPTNYEAAVRTCHRLLGLLAIEEKNQQQRSAAPSSSTTSSTASSVGAGAVAVHRLKEEVRHRLTSVELSAVEERRTKVLAQSAFDTERRDGAVPGPGVPAVGLPTLLFRCPPSGTLTVDTLLASVRTPWLHAALAADSAAASSSSSTTTSSTSASMGPPATPVPLKGARTTTTTTATPSGAGSGSSAPPSRAVSNDRQARFLCIVAFVESASLNHFLPEREAGSISSWHVGWEAEADQLRTQPIQQQTG